MNIINFFKPAPALPEDRDATRVKQNYKYWRMRIFTSIYVGYIFYYFTRKSYTCIMPVLMTDLGLTKGDLGILASIMALSYGLSKFLSGIMADKSNPRIFMSVGLILTGVFNICFGYSSTVFAFSIFWGLTGWFQGWGAPPCAKLLTHWFSQKERGTWWGIWNSSHNVSGAIIPIIVGIAAQFLGWRYGMLIPGVLSILGGFLLLLTLRDTPQSLGLPPIEKFKNDYLPQKSESEAPPSVKELLFKYVLNNSYIWLLATAYFFIYLIRGAINDWTPLFLIETRGYNLVTANASIVWFEAGGLLGSFAAGWMSDKLFSGKRGPINVLFSAAVIFCLFALWAVPPGLLFLDYALVFATGFLIYGPQMLIGLAAVELSHKKAAGTATGFVGWVAYLGMAASGYPLGKITELYGWSGCFTALIFCALVAIALLLPLWAVRSNPRYALQEPEAQ